MNRPSRSAVVLVLDRLGSAFLGPYGNTWLDTPAWNELAAESLLVEFALADSPSLEEAYLSYWTGRHALGRTSRTGAPSPTLAELLADSGIPCELFTDDPTVAQHPAANRFRDVLMIEHETGDVRAADLDSTRGAQFFAALWEHWESLEGPALLWAHARGLGDLWDAPLELRQRFADEGDPEPPDLLLPPECRLAPGFDPDVPLGWNQAYAGQVIAWDSALATGLDAWRQEAARRQALLIVLSPRGYPLGEHLRVGPCDEPLFGELLQVPWLVRRPDGIGQLVRTHAFAQPPDLFATLLDWFGCPRPESVWGRSLLPLAEGPTPTGWDVAAATSPTEQAIRTRSWFLRRLAEHVELYVKPDDRWEVNEIHSRCRDAAEQLPLLLDQFRAAAELGQREAVRDEG